MHVLQAFGPHQPPHDVHATVVPKGPRLTLLSQQWAAAATLTPSVLCASGPACATGELPDLPFALCWVPPLSAVDQTPSFLVVASKMLQIPNVSGNDGGHQVLGEGGRAERMHHISLSDANVHAGMHYPLQKLSIGTTCRIRPPTYMTP